MDIIFRYDQERLLAYSRNKLNEGSICVEESGSLHLFSFPGVDYFNYTVVGLEDPLEKATVDFIRDFYNRRDIRRYRLLVPSANAGGLAVIQSDPLFRYTRSLKVTRYPFSNNIVVRNDPRIQFVSVNEHNILKFTEIYLKSFDATGRNIETVNENFRQLLELKGLTLHLLLFNNREAGIGVLYQYGHEYFLAGGGVVPGLRNRAIHKASMAKRVNQSLSDPLCGNIISWAYDQSISYQNMIKLNFVALQEWNIYEYNG